MTIDEAKAFLQSRIDLIDKYYPQAEDYREALDMAIKALEQQPCEDCISRADVLALAEKGILVSNGNYQSVCKAINDLPSVQPQRGDRDESIL